MHVGIAALPGSFPSMLSCVLDILTVAEALRPSLDRGIPPIETTVVGASSRVPMRGNIVVHADRVLGDPIGDLDVLVVPALGVLNVAELESALALKDVECFSAALRDGQAGTVPTLAGACTGTFVLAESGRLDGISAATCWWLSGAFQRRYPQVTLDESRMVVRSGTVVTAGAAFAHIDLAMSLVADVSGRLADTVARHMLVDDRPARSSEALLGHLASTDVLVTRFEDAARRRLGDQLDIAELADALNVTRRTLERHVRHRTGLTPGQLIQRLRVESARHLRRTTELSMDQVAARVGYASGVTLRRAMAAN